MQYSKTAKMTHVHVTHFVTMKELLEMAEYLRNFKAKYGAKKSARRRKIK